MKVILRETVGTLGKRGDIVEVADGYGRNYLIPLGKATRATPGAEREAEGMRRAQALRDAQEIEGAEAIAARLGSTPMTIASRASEEGRLFGSVAVSEIVEAASANGVKIERRAVLLDEPIKEVGDHSVTIKLHPEVSVAVIVHVVAEES